MTTQPMAHRWPATHRPPRSLLKALALLMVLAVPWKPATGRNDMRDTTVVRVMGVTITGNKVTRDRIILREMIVQEGDTMSSAALYDRLERSRQNLVNTGLFNTVAVLPLYLDMRSVILEVTVNERWYIWPAVVFDLADPNFNTWWLTKDLDRVNYGLYLYKYNFRGQNETVYVKAQFGYTHQLALRYRVPYLDKKQRWGMSLGGSYFQQAEITAGTADNKRLLIRNPDGSNRDEWKADVEATLRRRHDIRHSWRLGYTEAGIRDTIARVALDYFNGDATDTRFLSLGYSVTWDRRDVRVFPREGHYAELRVDRYGLGLLDKNSPDITTAYATATRWWRPYDRLTLALALRGKRTFGTPPYYVQEGLGYRNAVRGYEFYVIDGEHYALGKANIVFALLKPRNLRVEAIPIEAFRTLYFALYLDAFVDAGRVWDSRYAGQNFLADQWMSGYGLGLDLVTSYDQVVRGEYTLNALGEHGFFLHFTQPF
ncbi:MAG: BamA/TamA family outer membrane protein [Flavobacteriales bacterium]|nr:BamA/TamA family outer membrane protein [Flavobacteriales bacterium]